MFYVRCAFFIVHIWVTSEEQQLHQWRSFFPRGRHLRGPSLYCLTASLWQPTPLGTCLKGDTQFHQVSAPRPLLLLQTFAGGQRCPHLERPRRHGIVSLWWRKLFFGCVQFVSTIFSLSSCSCYVVGVGGYSQVSGDSLLACIICSHLEHLESIHTYNVAMIAVKDEYTVALLSPETQETAEEITIVISLEYFPLLLLLLECQHLCANTENLDDDRASKYIAHRFMVLYNFCE